MNNFNFITKQDKLEQLYFQLPKSLMYESKYKELSANAKLVYSMLLDRTNLSIDNNWFDELHRAYIICELDEIEIYLNCSRGTANKVLNELSKFSLIMKVRQGQGKANLLYVAKITTTKETLDTHLKFHKKMLYSLKDKRKNDKEARNLQKSKNCTSIENTSVHKQESPETLKSARSIKNELLEVQILDGNKTEYKETETVVDRDIKPNKLQYVKRYFNLTSNQEDIVNSMSIEKLKEAIEITIAQNGRSFSYMYKVYKSLENKKADATRNSNDLKRYKSISSKKSISHEHRNNKPKFKGGLSHCKTIVEFNGKLVDTNDINEDEFNRMVEEKQRLKWG